jgi:RNA-dependent RNA polymerase
MRFEFLGYSNSALREHAVWFVSPFEHPEKGHITANYITDNLGNFDRLVKALRLVVPFVSLSPLDL